MCGEYAYNTYYMGAFAGSPPRVRGILLTCVAISSLERITPACAGNTSKHLSSATVRKDHPRVCGEYFPNLHDLIRVVGSPPRVRGIQDSLGYPRTKFGITPACAGNTLVRYSSLSTSKDHPRVCGEYSKKIPWLTPCHLN